MLREWTLLDWSIMVAARQEEQARQDAAEQPTMADLITSGFAVYQPPGE